MGLAVDETGRGKWDLRATNFIVGLTDAWTSALWDLRDEVGDVVHWALEWSGGGESHEGGEGDEGELHFDGGSF